MRVKRPVAQASRSISSPANGASRELVDAIAQLAWATDPTGRLLEANPRWAQYAGAAPAASVPLREALDVHPDDARDFDQRWSAVLSTGEAFERTVRLRRHDGVYRWFLVLVVPDRDGTGT